MKLHKPLILSLLIMSIPLNSLALSTEKVCPQNNPYHLVVNKTQSISSDFIPQNLVVPNVKFSFSGFHEKKQMEAGAAKALELMFNGAKKEGIILTAVSGYRSYDRQVTLYNNYVARDGKVKADTYSARPGTSEHQTGLTMDLSSASNGYNLTTSFGTTKEGIWLKDHAHQYGFIIRYPKNKESITGYMYEPWHVRYVGTDLSTYLYENNLTLEELETCCIALPDFSSVIATPYPMQAGSKGVKLDPNTLIQN